MVKISEKVKVNVNYTITEFGPLLSRPFVMLALKQVPLRPWVETDMKSFSKTTLKMLSFHRGVFGLKVCVKLSQANGLCPYRVKSQ